MSMTVERAIEVLEYSRGYEGMNFGAPKIALDMAISALEEIQQYRAIGTVEELKSMKENGAFSAFEMAQLIAKMNKLKEYESIGTVSELRELKEKATAKKLKHGVCPNCSTNNDMIIKNLGNPQGHKTIFCWNCGSCIDWSEGKE